MAACGGCTSSAPHDSSAWCFLSGSVLLLMKGNKNAHPPPVPLMLQIIAVLLFSALYEEVDTAH